MIRKYSILALLLFYALIAIFTIFHFNGTGDSGDSIMHYLFAKYAPVHPELFFDHWAKPLYVLLASPFAQFGIIGIKIFNVLIGGFTIYFTFLIAKQLNLKNAILGSVFLIFFPLNFILLFSGLTEPLFALIISIGIYFATKKKYLWASIIVSFLPFIRSEGLIIISVFAFYFIIKKEWKFLPFLFLGHFVYSIAGFFVYEDFLWVFNKIPYSNLDSPYGSGSLFHFINHLISITGVPAYLLFLVGFVSIVLSSLRKKLYIEIRILIFLGFFVFFIAHSLFWYLGIFNSMGLIRVFIGVVPLISIITLIGFNTITENKFLSKKVPKILVQIIFVAGILIFPFTPNIYAIDWEKDMKLTPSQVVTAQVSDYIQSKIEYKRLIYNNPYLSEKFDIDHFDKNIRQELNISYMNNIKDNDVIIWDSWYSVVERGISKNTLENNSELTLLHEAFDKNEKLIYAVFKKNQIRK